MTGCALAEVWPVAGWSLAEACSDSSTGKKLLPLPEGAAKLLQGVELPLPVDDNEPLPVTAGSSSFTAISGGGGDRWTMLDSLVLCP